MTVYFGLGSNLGERRENLHQAVQMLREQGLQTVQVSPVVESPALLPEGAPPEWSLPFLNLVVEGEAQGSPQQWLEWTKAIERKLGREQSARWSPRAIDIDILLWGEEIIRSEALCIPHPQIHKRAFVISPLVHLNPAQRIPGLGSKTVLQWSMELSHIPLWMGILNITPDSFSDGGQHTQWSSIEALLDAMVGAGVHLVDVGAESTRPGATPLSAEEEWSRLQPLLSRIVDRLGTATLKPLLSVDTRHVQVAQAALELGVDIINDVSGLTSPDMIKLAAASNVVWVAMHHLSLPTDPEITLPPECDPVDELDIWLERQLNAWEDAGLDRRKIVFDPGIGFGKNSLQSLKILRRADRLRKHGLRVLVGHSRKSFMRGFSDTPPSQRDIDTIGASLKLCEKGVDILRVHDVPGHIKAYRAWSHLEA